MVSLRSRLKWIFPCLLLVVFIIFSCQEKLNTSNVDCNECYQNKPDSVDLVLSLTLNDQFDTIPVALYQGKIDNGTFLDTFYCFANPATIFVKANEEYSAKAFYRTSEKTIIAVDGTKQKLKHVTGACDKDCWVIEGVKLNLKLNH